VAGALSGSSCWFELKPQLLQDSSLLFPSRVSEICPAGARPALAPIPANVAAAVNPFSLSAQRHKAVGRPQLSADKQQQQPSVRFVLPAVSLPGRSPAMDADSGRLARLPAASATPAALPPPSSGRGAAATCGAASCGSPSPCVIFRGRLSFAAEADSGGCISGAVRCFLGAIEPPNLLGVCVCYDVPLLPATLLSQPESLTDRPPPPSA
jgi:hypothetical protein